MMMTTAAATRAFVVGALALVAQTAAQNLLVGDTQSQSDGQYASEFNVNGPAPLALQAQPAALSGLDYVGCYADSIPRALSGASFVDSAMTVDMCTQFCDEQGYAYAGVQHYTECFCGDSYDIYGGARAEADCNTPCAGDAAQMCGGWNRNSVYATGVYPFEGCFIDNDVANRLLATTAWSSSPGNSAETCCDHCQQAGFAYCGTENVGECFCGQTYDVSRQAPETDCNMGCSGDADETCGGWNRIAVYATRLSTGLSTEYPFEGCFLDINAVHRLLATPAWYSSPDNSAETCCDYCQQAGFAYCGTEHGSQCFCGQTYDVSREAPETDCNTACSGDADETCGGTWRISVYATTWSALSLLRYYAGAKTAGAGAVAVLALAVWQARRARGRRAAARVDEGTETQPLL